MTNKIPRANSRQYLITKSIDTNNCKITTSRMWERKDDPRNLDNWWFKFDESDLHKYQFILFCGALDYRNKEFKVLKVPTKYIADNLSKVDISAGSWINIYLSFDELNDLRSNHRLSFKQFVVQ